jgi:hypothetical protein
VIVVVQVIGGPLPSRRQFECRPVYHKNIRPAVVVIIEDRDSGAGRFDDVFLGIHAAKCVWFRQPGLRRFVDEVSNFLFFCAGFLLRLSFIRGSNRAEQCNDRGCQDSECSSAEALCRECPIVSDDGSPAASPAPLIVAS